jgi:catalase
MDRTCIPEPWTSQFGTTAFDEANSVSVGSDGSVLVAGYTLGDLVGTSAGGYDAFVRKYDAAGTVLWTQQFGTTAFDAAQSVSVGSDGSVLVAGYTTGDLGGTNAGSGDAFVRKYDAAGTVLWTQQFGTTTTDDAQSVSVGSDGSVLVAGRTNGDLGGTNAGGSDAFVRKYDAAGTVLWTQQFGTSAYDRAQSVSVGSDGSVLVAGHTGGDLGGTSAGGIDAFVMALGTP